MIVFISLNLEASFISARFDFSECFDKYIFSSLTLSSLIGAIWLALVNIFSTYIIQITGIEKLYLNLMVIYIMALSVVNMFQGRERYSYKYKISVSVSLAISILTALLSIVFVACFKDRLLGRILGSVIPTITISVGLYAFLAYKGRSVDIHYWKYALLICLPYIPHMLSLTLLNSMDRIMITKICGAEDTALYSLAYTCGSIITLLITSMNTAFGPWLGEKLFEGAANDIRQVSRGYIGIFTFLAAGIMLITPEVLLIMGGNSYRAAIYVMPPVAFGCVCQFLYTLFVNVEQFKKKTIGMAYASISAAVFNYFLNMFFIPRYGFIAAAYTTLASYLWLLFVHMFLVYRLDCIRVYPIPFIFAVITGMGLYTIVINYLYGLDIVRYVLVLTYIMVFSVTVWKYRSKLKALLKRS